MSKNNTKEIQKEVNIAVMKSGVRCDLAGFRYLCCAVELVLKNSELVNSLCKDLYSLVAKEFGIENSRSVERSIRHAIDQTASTKTFSGLNKMFGVALYNKNEKPTAGELIRLLAEYCRLEMYKK